MSELKIITWNIGNPSIERFEKQIHYLIKINADVLVLSEMIKGDKLVLFSKKMLGVGYKVYVNENFNDRYCVLIAIKSKLNYEEYNIEGLNYTARNAVIELHINNTKIYIVGTYFPANNRKKINNKLNHTKDFFKIIESLKGRNVIVCGDFNSVKYSHIPRFNWFRKWEYGIFDYIEENGLVDAYLYSEPTEAVYSWFGHSNIGHLYDYIFVSNKIFNKIERIEYDHIPRLNRLSDHSMITLLMGGL